LKIGAWAYNEWEGYPVIRESGYPENVEERPIVLVLVVVLGSSSS
jgi:hypothetical protein